MTTWVMAKCLREYVQWWSDRPDCKGAPESQVYIAAPRMLLTGREEICGMVCSARVLGRGPLMHCRWACSRHIRLRRVPLHRLEDHHLESEPRGSRQPRTYPANTYSSVILIEQYQEQQIPHLNLSHENSTYASTNEDALSG